MAGKGQSHDGPTREEKLFNTAIAAEQLMERAWNSFNLHQRNRLAALQQAVKQLVAGVKEVTGVQAPPTSPPARPANTSPLSPAAK